MLCFFCTFLLLSPMLVPHVNNFEYRGSRGANPATQARGLISRVNNTHRLAVSLISVSISIGFKKPAQHTDKQMNRYHMFTPSLCKHSFVFVFPTVLRTVHCSLNLLDHQYVIFHVIDTPRGFMCFRHPTVESFAPRASWIYRE